MKKINENNYVSYTISFRGCAVTMFALKEVLRRYKEFEHARLLGNKSNGESVILDEK